MAQACAVFCLGATAVAPTLAQQTIFNVPSADITGKAVIYLEHESQFRPWGDDRYWYGTHYVAYGLSPAAELDLTLYNLAAPASDNASLGAGLKLGATVPGSREPRRELRWTAGGQALLSLQGKGAGFWTYAHLSGRIVTWKTRLTLGASGGTRQLFGRSTLHAIAGLEQPITSRVSALADWYSGRHGLAFFTAGFSVSTRSARTSFFFGCQIPNDRQVSGGTGLTFELAHFH